MDSKGPKRLEYIAPREDDAAEPPGVSRYYREPPEFANVITLAVGVLVVIGLLVAIGIYWLRQSL